MQVLIDLVKRWEGFSPTPYLCPAGFWTIGYGTLCKKDTPSITEEEATQLMLGDIYKAMGQTIDLCPILLAHPNKLYAITDFTYNLGYGRLKSSTLRKRINNGSFDSVPYELKKWVWGGGKKLPGLVARREQEIKLFLST